MNIEQKAEIEIREDGKENGTWLNLYATCVTYVDGIEQGRVQLGGPGKKEKPKLTLSPDEVKALKAYFATQEA